MMPPESDAKPTMKAPKSGVKIRMYDLKGEGDCFLLAFRGEDDTERYMLIDCGIFVGTSGGAKRLRDVAKDIAEATGNHLHFVVATHEHWDHLIGFYYARETFGDPKMVIDEVWLAWTENREDELADKLHKKYEAVAMALERATMHLEKLGDPRAISIKNVLAYHNKGRLGVTTTELMDKVHKELSSHPAFYCYPDNPPISLPEVPGIRFYILGPPRNEELLKILEEESSLPGEPLTLDEETAFSSAVLAIFGAEEQPIYELSRPFNPSQSVTREEAQTSIFFQEHYGFLEEDPEKGWRRIDNDWLAAAGNIALQMDDYTNNTSLVLALELIDSGKVLLFPGDAQAGNWRSWKDTSWSVEDKDGEIKEIKGMNLVERTAFYKVGHHGSHNGTLVEYLKKMRGDLVAMIPVNAKWAKKKPRYWEHPGKTLLKKLKKQTKGRIIRADTRIPSVKPENLSQSEWNEFKGNVEEDQNSGKKLWIQYTVPDRVVQCTHN